MIKRYKNSLEKINIQLNRLDCKISEYRLHSLYKQILRDKLFALYSKEETLHTNKINKIVLLFSIFKAIKLIVTYKKYDKTICVQKNLFTTMLLDSLHKRHYKIYDSLNNPITGLKFFSYILVYKHIYLNKRKRKNYHELKKIDIDGINLGEIYIIFQQQIIHAVITQKYFTHLIYFSLGTPSYGRYIYSKYSEIQHGVLHKYHPAILPIAKVKGYLLISSIFLKYKNYTKVKIIKQKDIVSNIVDIEPLVLCFPSLFEDNENKVIDYVKHRNDNIKIYYHPRSNNYKPDVFNSVENRLIQIKGAKKIYIGLSSVIIDVYLLGCSNFVILLTKYDCTELGIENKKSAVEKLSSLYLVPLNEEQIIYV